MSDRMIIEDPQGRVVSVPSHAIPKGSRIIRPDVLPGASENTFEAHTSEAVNESDEPQVVILNDGAPVLMQDGKIVEPEPEENEAEDQTEESVSVSPRKKK